MSALEARPVRARDPRLTEARGLSGSSLAWFGATYRRGWAVSLWLCLAVAMALPVALPLIGAMGAEAGLAATLARDGGLTVEQDVPDADAFGAFERDVDGRVAARVGTDLVPLTAYATAGPLSVATVNGAAAPAGMRGLELTAGYLDHLAAHVEVTDGLLPPDGLGGGETAVTMSRAGADQLGLRLTDRFCTGAGWCARLVGLWRPLVERDPFWGASAPRLQLTMGRHDVFQLVKPPGPGAAVAGLRYWPDSAALDAGRAADLARQVRRLTGELAAPRRRVVTRLDRSLEQFSGRQGAVSSTISLFSGAVALLGLFAVALASARFLDGRSRELAVLRARGWPWGRVWSAAFAGLGALGLCALPAALAAVLLLLALSSVGGSGVSALSLRTADLRGSAAAGAACAAGLFGVMALLAAGIASREVEPSLDEALRRRRPRRWRGACLVLATLGLPALLLPRLPGSEQVAAWGRVDLRACLAMAPALGLVLLAGAAVRLLASDAWAPLRRDSVSRLLAGWQLERRPEQHAGAALVLVLATASGVFAALALAAWSAPASLPAQAAQPALRAGLESALLAGSVGALGLGLAGFGLHFRSAARRRLREYGGLFAHGLPAAQAASSQATEQAVTVLSSTLAGGILGVGLALAALPLWPFQPAVAGLALGGVAAVVVCLLGGALVVGVLVRRPPARTDLVRHRWDP